MYICNVRYCIGFFLAIALHFSSTVSIELVFLRTSLALKR